MLRASGSLKRRRSLAGRPLVLVFCTCAILSNHAANQAAGSYSDGGDNQGTRTRQFPSTSTFKGDADNSAIYWTKHGNWPREPSEPSAKSWGSWRTEFRRGNMGTLDKSSGKRGSQDRMNETRAGRVVAEHYKVDQDTVGSQQGTLIPGCDKAVVVHGGSMDEKASNVDDPSPQVLGSGDSAADARDFRGGERQGRQLLSEDASDGEKLPGMSGAFVVSTRRRVRRQDPTKCWSKLERPLYHTALRTPSSAAFKTALAEYRILQDRCTQDIRDWTRFYMGHHDPIPEEDPGASAGPDATSLSPSTCKYLLWMPPLYAGLGNRILSLVSAFLYAMLTGRALLVGPSEVLAQIICNPFGDLDQPWLISPSGFRTMYQNIKDWQPKPGDFAARVRNGTVWDRRASYADLRYTASYDDWVFYCDSVQAGLRQAKFVGLHTDEYTVPGFYMVSAFKVQLERWFPQGQPFTHTVRFLVHPANYLWKRITRAHHTYLAKFHRRVGIQIRTFYKQDGPASSRVLQCAVDVAGVLPPVFATTAAWEAALRGQDELAQKLLRSPPSESVVVMVASLGANHFRFLQKLYQEKETRDGTLVALHSEGHDGEEMVGDQGQYERAMQEMWLLSFSDNLLVSDASSFGYVAAGLAGIRPHSMNICFRPKIGLDWYTNGRPVCAQAPSSEPCYLAPPKSFQCPGKGKWSNPMDEPFGLQQCSTIKKGLELSTS